MRLRTPVRRAAGFTFVELGLIIVVIGIVAACAAPRFFDDRTFLHRGYYEELAAALRLSQKLAVVSGCPVRVVIDAVGYTARQQGAGGRCNPAPVGAPGIAASDDANVLAGSMPLGLSVSPATLTFDALGRADLAVDQVIDVGPFALTVLADNGFIQAP